jgi:hypothetical protein
MKNIKNKIIKKLIESKKEFLTNLLLSIYMIKSYLKIEKKKLNLYINII